MKLAIISMRDTLVVFLMIALVGCTTEMGHVISTEQVKSIVPGKTNRSDLKDKLGSPLEIVVRRGIVELPTPIIKGFTTIGEFPNAFYKFNTDTFFTLFPESKECDCRIYYYHHAVSQRFPIFLLIYWSYSGKTQTDRLWVLVNEKTGIVENYAYKRYEMDTVFGNSH